MGIPVNEGASKKGCTPISSSCVIWQGKDIDCLELCKGDSIDEVIHQLGCMLCTIKDQLDVDTYDLECLNMENCDVPHTFRELMQYIIGVLCQLKDGYLNGPSEEVTAEEITVAVAHCFQANGINQTVSDYIKLIGEEVCRLQTEVAQLKDVILQMQARLDVLEG